MKQMASKRSVAIASPVQGERSSMMREVQKKGSNSLGRQKLVANIASIFCRQQYRKGQLHCHLGYAQFRLLHGQQLH